MRARITAAVFAVLVSVALPRAAHATPGFPGEIQTHLGLAAQPSQSCSLCHTTGSAGGKGTVNTPFGTSVRGHGAVANDSAALDTALDGMAKDGTDSDGDKVPDITELKNGTDPNVNDVTVTVNDAGVSVIEEGGTGAAGSGASDAPPPPQYGCSLTRAGSSGGDAPYDVALAFGVVTLSLAVTRRGKRKGHRS